MKKNNEKQNDAVRASGAVNAAAADGKRRGWRELSRREQLVLMLKLAAVLVAVGAFVKVYLTDVISGAYKLYELIAPALTLTVFTFVFILIVPKLVEALFGEKESGLLKPDELDEPKNKRRDFFIVCGAALAMHIVFGILGALIFKQVDSYGAAQAQKGFYELWRASWMKGNTDAGHYLKIAEHWYLKEGITIPGDPKPYLLIVFFPMLPVMIAGIDAVIHNAFVSAQIINAAATSLAAGMCYLTLLPLMGGRRARAGAFIALLLPGMVLMNSPMSEPLFLLFTVTAFYFIGKKSFLLAGLFTALAGFTRSLGVLTAVPLAIVGIGHIVSLIREKKPWAKAAALLALALVISTLGTLGYLYINYSIHGDALKFFEYQWSNWYQKATPFFDTPRYMVDYFADAIPKHIDKAISLWGMGTFSVLASFVIVRGAEKRLPSYYTVYFLAYFAVAIGCSWLLSATRYLSAAFPVTAGLALTCEKKRNIAIVFTVLVLLYIGYMFMYMKRWDIY